MFKLTNPSRARGDEKLGNIFALLYRNYSNERFTKFMVSLFSTTKTAVFSGSCAIKITFSNPHFFRLTGFSKHRFPHRHLLTPGGLSTGRPLRKRRLNEGDAEASRFPRIEKSKSNSRVALSFFRHDGRKKPSVYT